MGKPVCQNSNTNHNVRTPACCTVEADGVQFCALIDTGAQVSLIGDDTLRLLKQRNPNLKIMNFSGKLLAGVSGVTTEILGYVNLRLTICNLVFPCGVPFAVVKSSDIPFCAVVGANFLIANNIVIDFQTFQMHVENPAGCGHDANNCGAFFPALLNITLSDTDTDSVNDGESLDEVANFSSLISRTRLIEIQNEDIPIAMLKRMIVENVPAKFCDDESLSIF